MYLAFGVISLIKLTCSLDSSFVIVIVQVFPVSWPLDNKETVYILLWPLLKSSVGNSIFKFLKFSVPFKTFSLFEFNLNISSVTSLLSFFIDKDNLALSNLFPDALKLYSSVVAVISPLEYSNLFISTSVDTFPAHFIDIGLSPSE